MPPVNLNGPQLEAVEHLTGPLLILAGAGSGKTRVITHRAARLLGRGIPPKNLLCVTFTNKAAKEMKERIGETSGDKGLAVPVMTFHAFCLRILKREIHHLGRGVNFTVLAGEDQKQLFYEVCRDLGVDLREIPDDEIRSRISRAKNDCVAVGESLGDDPVGKMAALFYPRYQAGLKRLSALDFDDLLMMTVELFEKFPTVVEKYRRQFKFIMVDEYQDTNKAQYRVLRELAKEGNVAVVGDDDQSIYSWRGADIENIRRFLTDFPGAKIVKLEENYRSTATILKAANAVIAHNPERTEKALWSNLGEGEIVKTFDAEDAWDEAEKIADEIGVRNLKEGLSWRQFAVLYRTHTQSRPFEEVFQRRGIPYQISGKIDFYDRREIKDVLAYLKVLHNPDDDLSLLRIVNYPKRGIGDHTVILSKELAEEGKVSVFQGLKMAANHMSVKTELKKEIVHFTGLIERYRAVMVGPQMVEPLREFIGHIQFLEEIDRESGEPLAKEKRKEGVKQLLNAIDGYAKKAKKPSLSDYLVKLALFFSQEEVEEGDAFEQNAVHLLTIHASKGLEFPHVYIPGFEEYMIPFSRTISIPIEEKAVQEERRLCYVAMTRAQRTLTLTMAASRRRQEGSYQPEPSRYLAEIPDELILRQYGAHRFGADAPKAMDRDEVANLGLAKMRERLAAAQAKMAAPPPPPTP